MGRERFKEGKRESFFADFVYEQVVPKDQFLVKLNEVVPWQRFTYKLVKYYRGKAKEGRPPYDPALLLIRAPAGAPLARASPKPERLLSLAQHLGACACMRTGTVPSSDAQMDCFYVCTNPDLRDCGV